MLGWEERGLKVQGKRGSCRDKAGRIKIKVEVEWLKCRMGTERLKFMMYKELRYFNGPRKF